MTRRSLLALLDRLLGTEIRAVRLRPDRDWMLSMPPAQSARAGNRAASMDVGFLRLIKH